MSLILRAEDFQHPQPIRPCPHPDYPLTIGIQGGVGSFNDEAVRHYTQQAGLRQAKIQYLYTSDAVLAAVARGDIQQGQCAIYNSAGGFVDETVDALQRYPVHLAERFAIPIAHALMCHPLADPEQINTIMCHPQVLAQCRNTLAQRYPHLRQRSGAGELIDNAKIAEALGNGHLPPGTAIMGSRILASIYHLQVLDDQLQDLQHNLTYFIHVVAKPIH